ncbi:MAG: hypothetical protein IT357_06780 [Gemmatimonadaceae bacterium]|nr:hypothetical protein [Gemmatimonadaceae bacterium]
MHTTRSTAGAPRIDSAGQTVLRMPEDDRRRVLVGRWHVEFRWEARRRALIGAIELRDSIVSTFPVRGVRSLVDADFATAFGLSFACLDQTRGVLGVAVTGSEVEFDFSPWCLDNNLKVRATLRDREIVGRWTMVRFAGPGPEGGTFRMWRDGS